MSLKTRIEEEVLDQISELHKMDVGTEEYRVAVDGIEKLAKLHKDMERDGFERDFKACQLEAEENQKKIENELKERQIEVERKRGIRDTITQAVGTGVTVTAGVALALYGSWFEVERYYPDMGTKEIMKQMITGIFRRK